MIKIIDNKSTGKTSRLMLLAKESNGIIVCSNPERFSRKALNYDLVGISFISYEDYITNLSQYTERNIFIDEVSDFLEHISNFSIRGYTESK